MNLDWWVLQIRATPMFFWEELGQNKKNDSQFAKIKKKASRGQVETAMANPNFWMSGI